MARARCPLVVAVSVMHPPSCGSRSSAPRDGAPGEPSGLTRRAASVEGHVRHRVTSGLLSTRRWWRRALPRRRRGGGRTLAKARDHIRDATALWFEVGPDAFIVIEDIRFPKPVKATVDRARKERAKAQAGQEAAAGATEKAARALVDEGWLSVRDPADILGLSHQRVQQILAS